MKTLLLLIISLSLSAVFAAEQTVPSKKIQAVKKPQGKTLPVVRNGDFSKLVPVKNWQVISSKEFPAEWGAHTASYEVTADGRKQIRFSNLLWQRLNLPFSGGSFEGKVTLSGKGSVTAYLVTSPGKAPHVRRAPDFGPFILKDEPQTFSFTFQTVRGELGYLYFKAAENSEVRLYSASIEKR